MTVHVMVRGSSWNRSPRRSKESVLAQTLGQPTSQRDSAVNPSSRRKQILLAGFIILAFASLGTLWTVQHALGSSARGDVALHYEQGHTFETNKYTDLVPTGRQKLSASAQQHSRTGSSGVATQTSVGTRVRFLTETVLQAVHLRSAGANLRNSPSANDDLPERAAFLPGRNQTLRFPVCNGFTNQRLSLVYGILLARRLNRVPVLPGHLLRDGTQVDQSTGPKWGGGTSSRSSDSRNHVPFGDVYDTDHFLRGMAKAGIRVLLSHEAPSPDDYTSVDTSRHQPHVISTLTASYGDVLHLEVDCPLFRMSPPELEYARDGPVIWAVLDALRPADEVQDLVTTTLNAVVAIGRERAAASKGRGKLAVGATPVTVAAAGAGAGAGGAAAAAAGGRRAGGGAAAKAGAAGATPHPTGGFNFLHLRMENEWLEHCARWSAIPDGVVRDNCYNHTETVDQRLASFGFTPELPLYVAADWADVDVDREQEVLGRLTRAGYTLVTSRDAFPQELRGRDRELRAAVEYHLGLRAERHIGNSVSTFSALALLERRRHGRWSAYYNGGNLPLAPYLPVHKVPWVFTYNSWSEPYDYMLRAAVRSAVAIGTLTPYCIFDGNLTSPIARWLADQGVALIRHVPAWREELLARAQSKLKANKAHSHLYSNPDTLVSTFQRVDLPVVPVLDQYTYVLYTDADMYFRRPIHLEDFGLPLPRSISMSYEIDKMFPYNAGIILANLPVMRENYKSFIAMMLDNDLGLYYPNYGPADQGIMNKYYESDLRAQMLNQAFNTKPYNAFDPQSFIVHFHGPKPHDYLRFLENGDCGYGRSLCARAFRSALCPYAREWAAHAQPSGPPSDGVPPDPVGLRLADVCTWLANPTFGAIFTKMRPFVQRI